MSTDKQAAAQAVGAILQAAREAAGLTKYQAADAAGLSEGRWRQLERGIERKAGVDYPASTSPSTLVRIAQGLEIDAAELLEAAGYPPDAAEEQPRNADLVTRNRTVPVTTLDVTGLTPEQVALAKAYIAGLRAGN